MVEEKKVDLNEFFKKIVVFHPIKYKDSDHTYLYGDVPCISGTSLIHKYTPEFDSISIAERVATKEGVSVGEILNRWAITNATSTVKGTLLHEYVELKFQKRVAERDDKQIKEMIKSSLKRITTYDPEISDLTSDINEVFVNLKVSYNETVPQINDFLNKSNGALIPLMSEFIIGDEDYRVCGTIDQLFYNETYKTLQIWDWKTNKKIDIENIYKDGKYMLEPISNIENSNFWHYSIQLSLYKFILEKNTGIVTEKLWLCHFNEANESFVIIECPYLEREVKLILEDNLAKILKKEVEMANEREGD